MPECLITLAITFQEMGLNPHLDDLMRSVIPTAAVLRNLVKFQAVIPN